MRRSNLKNLPALLVIMLLTVSCFSRKDRATEETSTEPTQTEETAEAPPKNARDNAPKTAVQPSQQIQKVNVFLEASGGMVGFMPRGGAASSATPFQNKVAGLFTEINFSKAVGKKDYYYILEKNGNSLLQKSTYNDLLKTVSSGIEKPALGTELPEMLEGILKESAKDNAVSVVISDFIYGPADKSKFAIIPQLIRGALNEASNREQVISVFGFQSNFSGTFHPAVKTPVAKRQLSGVKMPYYVWVIGKQEDVLAFNQKVLKTLPDDQAHFGFNRSVPEFEALTKYNPKGNVYCSSRNPEAGCKAITLDPQKDTPVEFEIGVNLENYPGPLQSSDYLKNKLEFAGRGITGTILSVKKADAKTKGNPTLEKYSHFVRVRVTEASAKSGSLTLTLPAQEPAWVNQWTTQNDNDPQKNPGKTFKLNEVLSGVQSLYGETSKKEFQISITFNKG